MKDIFFGATKKIVRYGYLRKDVDHMKKLYDQIDRSKLIIFNRKNNRLETLSQDSKLVCLNVNEHNILKNFLTKWLTFNTNMQHSMAKNEIMAWKDIDSDLKKISIFWLGMDDFNVISDSNESVPVYALDISKSRILCEFIDEKLIGEGLKYTTGISDIKNMSNEDATVYSYAKMYIDFIEKNNYCPSCGGHVIAVNLGSRLYCLNDSPYDDNKCNINLSANNLQFPRTDPVVIIALYDERGRILLGHNPRHKPIEEIITDEKTGKTFTQKKKMYSCFSGFMEPGERIEQACVREVYEETGIRIKDEDIKIIESQPWPFPANLMVGCIGIVRKDESDDSKINIHLDNELTHVKWFDSITVDKVINKNESGILFKNNDIVEKWFCPPLSSIAGKLLQQAVIETSKGKL